MKYLIITFIGLWFFTACMTTKRVKRNCDLFADVCITETETKYRDTTAAIHIPEVKAKDKIPVKIEDENKKPVMVVDDKKGQVPIKKEYVNSELSVLTVPYARSTAQVVNSRLEHELTQTDTLLFFKLENALKTVKRQEKIIKVLSEKYIVEIEVNKPFAKFTIKWFFGSLLLMLIGIAALIFKYKTRIIGLLK